MEEACPVHVMSLPEYDITEEPEYDDIGPKLDQFVIERLQGRRVALRALCLADHPDLEREALISIIQSHGTDRCDPDRPGMHHDWYESLGVELHAIDCEVGDRIKSLTDEDYNSAPSFMGEFAQDFYASALNEPGRGYSMRIDLLLAFDLDRLTMVRDDNGQQQGFRFADPETKREALLAILSILNADEG